MTRLKRFKFTILLVDVYQAEQSSRIVKQPLFNTIGIDSFFVTDAKRKNLNDA